MDETKDRENFEYLFEEMLHKVDFKSGQPDKQYDEKALIKGIVEVKWKWNVCLRLQMKNLN